MSRIIGIAITSMAGTHKKRWVTRTVEGSSIIIPDDEKYPNMEIAFFGLHAYPGDMFFNPENKSTKMAWKHPSVEEIVSIPIS
jgi:hypothetical protein